MQTHLALRCCGSIKEYYQPPTTMGASHWTLEPEGFSKLVWYDSHDFHFPLFYFPSMTHLCSHAFVLCLPRNLRPTPFSEYAYASLPRSLFPFFSFVGFQLCLSLHHLRVDYTWISQCNSFSIYNF